jgi:hypothetical protein
MSETKKTPKPAAAGKFTKSAPAKEEKRVLATRHLFICLVVCFAAWVGIYTAQATGDMSTRLALGLSAAVLTAGAFYAGRWAQYMWPKEV